MSAGLNIAALSRRTGVAPDTLRKWEQRYQILRPMRTAGGQRRYDERDVARVEWLCERLREGYRIGEAATLLGTTQVTMTRTPEDHLRTILAAVDAGGGVRGSAVLACPQGERHELGLMMLAIALRRDGWKVIYLGADTPVDDAVAVAHRQAARVLGISCTVGRPQLPAVEGIEIVVGGPAAHAYTGGLAETVSAIRSFAA
jgi:transposase-like protein